MIIEDYVSFETAKLLKEKGFDEKCNASYRDYTSIYDMSHWITIIFDEEETDDMKFICYAPTLYKAMKWLREVHNINPAPYALSLGWAFDVFDLSNRDITGCKKLYSMDIPSKSEVYNTYEQACEAAIKYCLKKLI